MLLMMIMLIITTIVSANLWTIENYDFLMETVKNNTNRTISIFDFEGLAELPGMLGYQVIYYLAYPTVQIIKMLR